MKKVTNWLIWLAGVLGTAWIGSYFYDQTKDVPVLKYITGALNWLFDTIIVVANFQMKLWIVLVVLLGLFLLYLSVQSFKKDATPPFFEYKEDVLKKWLWRWGYKHNGEHWTISRLTPHCPNDKTQLVIYVSYDSAYCPKCNAKYPSYDVPFEKVHDIERLVIQRLSEKYPNTNPY